VNDSSECRSEASETQAEWSADIPAALSAKREEELTRHRQSLINSIRYSVFAAAISLPSPFRSAHPANQEHCKSDDQKPPSRSNRFDRFQRQTVKRVALHLDCA
jgi:hypothetical protein